MYLYIVFLIVFICTSYYDYFHIYCLVQLYGLNIWNFEYIKRYM